MERETRRSSLPVDVADIEDLAVHASNLRVGADEFGVDGSPAEVGSHAEIGNGRDQGDGSGDVVEDAVGTRPPERQGEEDEGGKGHQGTYGLQAASTMRTSMADSGFDNENLPSTSRSHGW